MGNQLQHVGLKLDKAHRASCVGCNDLTGSSDLEGGRRVKSDARINERISTFKSFKRDVLEAAAFSAVAADIVGFRLEFEIIGGTSVFWAVPRMTYVKVTQVFEHANAPPRLTSVRGFYILYFMLKDLWDSDSFAKEMAKADGASAASAQACASVKKLEVEDAAEAIAQVAATSDGAGASAGLGAKTLEDATGAHAKIVTSNETSLLQDVSSASTAKVLVNTTSAFDLDEHECPICMDARVAVAPPCGHGLCRNCYEEWRQHSDVCPTCRGDGTGSELWVDLIESLIPDGSEHVDDLMQAIHTYVQMLPRLETRWERQQRMLRQRTMRSRSSTLSTAASSSSLAADAAAATAEASLQRMLAEANHSAAQADHRSFEENHSWLDNVNENSLRRLDVSHLDEELQIEVAMRLSLAASG
ncbi:RING finger protein 141 [Hondaea fermentalgiana]|uniref:RING finger protein 141 n=1 Tax=Hondaea fermentalgiana TaxID=2315210 RepID=A0A2R5GCX7_9STRA|nr:RING finger protein 141 [Hondaea fermentalgiana]|eukprot:GBG26021.1 RING finger protein 141 [Hondaea fermentalgiana]